MWLLYDKAWSIFKHPSQGSGNFAIMLNGKDGSLCQITQHRNQLLVSLLAATILLVLNPEKQQGNPYIGAVVIYQGNEGIHVLRPLLTVHRRADLVP
jgi:hypothetical protein